MALSGLEQLWRNQDACSRLLGFMDARDFAALSQTSLAWSRSLLQDSLWRREYEREFGHPPELVGVDEGISARTLVSMAIRRCQSLNAAVPTRRRLPPLGS